MKKMVMISALLCAAVFCFCQPYIPAVGIGNTTYNDRVIISMNYLGQNGKPVFVDFDTLAAKLAPFFAGGCALDTPFTVLRVPEVGTTITGASNPCAWINWQRFAPPTIALNLSPVTSFYEVGTVNDISLNATTSNPAGATLGSGYLVKTAPGSVDTLSTWTGLTNTFNISFSPQQSGTGNFNGNSYTFRSYQTYSGTESGIAQSSFRNIFGVYPVLYFTSSTDFTSSTAGLYAQSNKLIEPEGNKAVNYVGSNVYIYYCIPKTWTDFNISEILDGSGFNVTPSFTAYDVNISSSGLTNNWTNVPYKMYRINSLTNVNAKYTFNR